MPRNTEARRRARDRRPNSPRIGRPPRPDAGDWEKFYVLLKTDVAAFVRATSRDEHKSLSAVISELATLGVAIKLDRQQAAEQGSEQGQEQPL